MSSATEQRGLPRIVHVSSAHRTSDVRIHLREAASLSHHGYEVYLVANRHDIELPDTGVIVIGLARRTRIQRIVVGSVIAVLTALRTRAQIFHLHDPELLWAVIPLRLLGKKVFYDAHEDLPEQVRAKPYLNSATRRPAVFLARFLIKLAGLSNHVIAATERIGARFPAGKVTIVRNYPILRSMEASPSPIGQRPATVGYLGVMSEERGTTRMIDAFASSYFPREWTALVAGPTSPDSYLDELMELPGWDRVEYRGFLSTDGARDLLHEVRVGVVTLTRTQAYVDSLPTKMFEYFAAGVPAIASDFPLWRSIIEEHDCGLLVDEESPDEIARAVHRYAVEPALLARHSANALRAARTSLNWGHEEIALLGAYKKILTGH